MNLQKKLIQLSEYKCSFKYVDSFFLISMTYPNGWSVIPSEDRTIEVAEENGVIFYAAPIETDIDKAFNLIDDTISYNLDVQKKMNLLKFNINKLQELFAEKDLEELETIEFVFKPKQKQVDKPKKATKSQKKSAKKMAKKKDVEETQTDVEFNNIYENSEDTEFDGLKILPCDVVDQTDYETTTISDTHSGNLYLEEVER